MVAAATIGLDVDRNKDNDSSGHYPPNKLNLSLISKIVANVQRVCNDCRYVRLTFGIILRMPFGGVRLSAARENHFSRLKLVTEQFVDQFHGQRP